MDTKNSLIRYQESDFSLTNGVELESIRTIVDNEAARTSRNLANILITYAETANIAHGTRSRITYNRINHIRYRYQLTISNTRNARSKVMVRIWLGPLRD